MSFQLAARHHDIIHKAQNALFSIDPVRFQHRGNFALFMQSDLEARIAQAFFDYDNMPSAQQIQKLDQILLLYTHGDAHKVEGLKLMYMSLVSGQS